MFLTSTDVAVGGAFMNTTPPESSDLWFMIIIIAAVIIFLVGLFKRAIVWCIIGGLIAAWLGLAHPSELRGISRSITSTFDGAIEPMKEEDNYGDILDGNATTFYIDITNVAT